MNMDLLVITYYYSFKFNNIYFQQLTISLLLLNDEQLITALERRYIVVLSTVFMKLILIFTKCFSWI